MAPTLFDEHTLIQYPTNGLSLAVSKGLETWQTTENNTASNHL
jgi:hypothetical protein